MFKFLLRLDHLLPCAFIALLTLNSCDKSEGEGGTSSISGKVVIRQYEKNSEDDFVEFEAMDERIYIIYGDDIVQSDEMRTSKDGYYRFEFLKKGKYQIYGYSECNKCDEKIEPEVIEVEINKNRTDYSVPEIILNRY